MEGTKTVEKKTHKSQKIEQQSTVRPE